MKQPLSFRVRFRSGLLGTLFETRVLAVSPPWAIRKAARQLQFRCTLKKGRWQFWTDFYGAKTGYYLDSIY